MLLPCAHCVIVSIKNTAQPRRNTPVFTTGQAIAETSTARYLFFFSSNLYTRPATKPQAVPFKITVITVPIASMVKKAVASPLKRTATPKTNPSHAPTAVPQVAAPTTMGISTSDTEKVPNLINEPMS